MSGIKFLVKHGKGNIEFGVTKLFNRKSHCLYYMRGCHIEPLAYFRSDEDAQTFQNLLDSLLEWFPEK